MARRAQRGSVVTTVALLALAPALLPSACSIRRIGSGPADQEFENGRDGGSSLGPDASIMPTTTSDGGAFTFQPSHLGVQSDPNAKDLLTTVCQINTGRKDALKIVVVDCPAGKPPYDLTDVHASYVDVGKIKIAVLWIASWRATAPNVAIFGDYPLAIVAQGDVFINTVVDVSAGDASDSYDGEGRDGTDSSNSAGGGGGGSFATLGATGGTGNSGGKTGAGGGPDKVYGGPDLVVGGSQGGDGGKGGAGGYPCSKGGSGGGALQISAGGSVAVSSTVNASGWGGFGGCSGGSGGGGGGAGGYLFFEALRDVTTGPTSTVVANGGGGGAGSPPGNELGANGQRGGALGGLGGGASVVLDAGVPLDGAAPAGGASGAGGNGAGPASPLGGASATSGGGGGGGGGAGRIYLRGRNVTVGTPTSPLHQRL
jgi:hypothetical protein